MALFTRNKAKHNTVSGNTRGVSDVVASVNGVNSGHVEVKPVHAVGVPHDQRTFFFINGHPRSGTNWLSSLCNLHPDVCCHGEFHYQVLYDALRRFTGKAWYVGSEAHVKPVAEDAMAQFVRRTFNASADQRKPGARVMGDHTPKPLMPLLPGAAYIVSIRDGRDVVVSWTFHLLRTGMPEIVHDETRAVFERELAKVSGDAGKLKDAAMNLMRDQEWVTRVAAGWALQVQNDLPTAELLRQQGSRVLVVRYEDMLANVEHGRGRLYEFLGVDPAKAGPLSRETHTTPGFGREDPSSFYRKGEAGDWKNYFDRHSAAWFKNVASRELIETGYETTDTW